MLSALQQEINNLLYIYFNALGLLQTKQYDLKFLLDELVNCKTRIEKCFLEEKCNDVVLDVQEDVEDARAFFKYFLDDCV